MIKTKSIYAKPTGTDGRRFLVELFWPEGLHTRYAEIDEWYRQLGPSYDLQRFEFDKSKWDSYKAKYRRELFGDKEKHSLLQAISRESRDKTVTLLYCNQDPVFNNAVILKELIERGVR